MTSVELRIVISALLLMLIVVLCVSCYRAGWVNADERWLETATRTDKVIHHDGRVYAAIEVMEEMPEIEVDLLDNGKYPPTTGREYLDGDNHASN